MTNWLSIIVKVFSNTLIFLLQKSETLLQKLHTFFFQQKMSMYQLDFKIGILRSHY